MIMGCEAIVCQNVCSGKLSTISGKPIADANIMIYPDAKSKLIAFTVSKENGTFSIEVNSKLDSLFLQIEHLSHEPYFKKVPIHTFVEIILQDRNTLLPELTISHDRIQKIGDTVYYDVGQFKKSDDINIEDVMRRLPGVEIEDNGKIKYKGEEISHFYIEGVDMLGSRYKIASRGINIEAVSEIQVLERHQHIKALKGLVAPTNAAINVKLKSGTTYTATYEVGLGAQPFNYQIKGNIFGFSKRQQFNVIGASNNKGINNSNLFDQISVSGVNFAPSFSLQVTNPITPNLKVDLYRLNHEHVLGVNFLKKLTQSLQVKYNGLIKQDKIKNIGNNNFSFYDGVNNFQIKESIQNSLLYRTMNHRVEMESNKEKVFFTSSLDAEVSPDQMSSDLIVNGNSVSENLKKSLGRVEGDMSVILRVKSKAYKIHSNINFDNHQDTLSIRPSNFTLPGIGAVSAEKAVQVFGQQFFNAHIYSSFNYKKKKLDFESLMGFKSRQHKLNTHLSGVQSQIEEHFVNRITNAWSGFYADQKASLSFDKTTLTFTLPLALQFFSFNSSNLNTESTDNKYFTYNPSASLGVKLNSEIQTTFSLGYLNNVDNTQIYFDRYVLTSNRMISRKLPEVNQLSGFNFSNSNVVSGLFGLYDMLFLNFNWFTGTQNQLQSNNFDPTSLVTQLINQDNKLQSFRSSGMFKTNAFKNKLIFDINYTFMLNWADQSFNNIIRKTRSSMTSLQSGIDYSPIDKFGIKSNFNLIHFGSDLSPASYTISYQGEAKYMVLKNLTLKLDINLVQNTTNTQATLNNIFGMELMYKLNSKKLQFILQGSNLTNIKNYQVLRQSTYYLQDSYYQMRPRQVFLVVRKLI
jgi:hypothetical protein